MFRSLRVRNYRLYAAGQLVSLTGTWMQRVAQDWLVLELTNSGTTLGIVTALQFLPSLLFGLWGGVLADRYDKRKLLLATQTGLALVALILGVLDVTGIVQYWQVLVLALALGLVSAIDSPVRQSFVVEMVGPQDLTNAVGLNSTIFNSARILGPAVAGVMITAIGTGWAFVANALSSIAVLTGLALMRPSELRPSPAIDRIRGQLRAGLLYVRHRQDLLLTMILVFVVGTFGLNFQITTALLVLVGLAMLTFTTAANSSVQLGVEATMRGRVMALYLMCFLGGTPLGAPIVGWVANTVGPRWGMVGGGLVCVAMAVGMALYLVRRRSPHIADVSDRWEKITSRY